MTEKPPGPSDAELLNRIKQKETNLSGAKEAGEIFFERHRQSVYKTVKRCEYKLNGFSKDPSDIVIETFERVWDSGAATFDLNGVRSPSDQIGRVRAWLNTIAANIVKSLLRQRKKLRLPVEANPDEEKFLAGSQASDDRRHSELHKLVASVLDEREIEILWLKIGHFDPITEKSQPPSDLVESICNKWKISEVVFRQIYARSLKKLKEAKTLIANGCF